MLKRAFQGLLLLALPLLAVPAMAAETVEVKMEKMAFVPQHVKVKAGTTVVWVNREKRTYHTVFFEKEGLPESDPMFPGDTWKRVFEKPGVYPYRCGPHPEMTGSIEVTE
jgi:plastocyanin